MTRNGLTWQFPIWLGLLIGATALLTIVYTCVTPFAAFAVIAATTLSRRQALACTALVWLANQAMGFGLLGYPPTAKTFAWGVVIGAAALIGTLAAQWSSLLLGALRAPIQILGGFAAAFVSYQIALYAAAVSFLGGMSAYSPEILTHVLVINAATLLGLVGLQQLIATGASLIGRKRTAAPARFA